MKPRLAEVGRAMPRLALILSLLLVASLTPAAAQTPEVSEVLRRNGQGERCLVCGERVFDREIVELRYKGRTFHVDLAMLGDFKGDPDRWFQELQARSAWFDERTHEGTSMWSGWLLLAVYVLAGLAFGALCGHVAVARSLSPLPWFFAGLLGNVAAFAVLLVAPRGDASAAPEGPPKGLAKVPTTRAPVACPACGGFVHPAATACSTCGAALTARVESEVARSIGENA